MEKTRSIDQPEKKKKGEETREEPKRFLPKKKKRKRKKIGRIPGSSIEVSLSVSTGMIENLFFERTATPSCPRF